VSHGHIRAKTVFDLAAIIMMLIQIKRRAAAAAAVSEVTDFVHFEQLLTVAYFDWRSSPLFDVTHEWILDDASHSSGSVCGLSVLTLIKTCK
jgi:hypothetical protein